MRGPLTFVTPSMITDSREARVKVKRDLEAILRAAERYLEPQEVDQIVSKVRKDRKGNKPDKAFNELLIKEYDAAIVKDPEKTRTDFAKGFYNRYRARCMRAGVRAVEKRLTRELNARERRLKQEQELKAALKRPSLAGTKLAGTK